MKKKAKGKAKVSRKRARTTDLGAKRATTVKGGIALNAPVGLKEISALKYDKY